MWNWKVEVKVSPLTRECSVNSWMGRTIRGWKIVKAWENRLWSLMWSFRSKLMEQPILCSVADRASSTLGKGRVVGDFKAVSLALSGLALALSSHSNYQVFNSCAGGIQTIRFSFHALEAFKLSGFHFMLCLEASQIIRFLSRLSFNVTRPPTPWGLLHALEAWRHFCLRNCWVKNGKTIYLVACE